jgi:hypothetical protein
MNGRMNDTVFKMGGNVTGDITKVAWSRNKTSLPHRALVLQCPYLDLELIKPASTLYHPILNMPRDKLELKAMVKRLHRSQRTIPLSRCQKS